ncbi:MAG TPA: protein-glutamate O-methyltransferase CheR [Myxococcales bacterium]|jgi:chemotaxis protein methyltransferase CheR
MSLALSPAVFNILSSLIEQRAGLHYRPDDLQLVRDKISFRAESLGFDSLLDYYYFLRYDPGGAAETDALVESLVVHETYFFRESDQLMVAVDDLLADKLAKGARIWCAASSTGEEPLTIAMMLAQRGLLQKAQIIASDVSERALSRARAGTFGPRSARALPPGIEGSFLRREGEKLLVDRALVSAIDWRRVNLMDESAVRALGHFDAILARNVLIYFADATVRRVVDRLSEALVPGGLLLVGASESLLRYGTSLSCEEHGGAFFYRKTS